MDTLSRLAASSDLAAAGPDPHPSSFGNEELVTMKNFASHATMRNGLSRPVVVTAKDQIDAARRIFALIRPASITTPKQQ